MGHHHHEEEGSGLLGGITNADLDRKLDALLKGQSKLMGAMKKMTEALENLTNKVGALEGNVQKAVDTLAELTAKATTAEDAPAYNALADRVDRANQALEGAIAAAAPAPAG